MKSSYRVGFEPWLGSVVLVTACITAACATAGGTAVGAANAGATGTRGNSGQVPTERANTQSVAASSSRLSSAVAAADDSVGLTLPLRGARDAQLTLISIVEPQAPEGRALYQLLRDYQQREGRDAVRWVLVSKDHISKADSVATALREHAGAGLLFPYFEALIAEYAAGREPGFAERLELGLSLTKATHAISAKPAALELSEASARQEVSQQLEKELLALAARGEHVPSLLSINGIHVTGLPAASKLLQLLTQELTAARALRARGVRDDLFRQRSGENAGRLFDAAQSGAAIPQAPDNPEPDTLPEFEAEDE